MITEDSNKIYIDDKKELNVLNKLNTSRYGSNSDIYLYKNKLLKIYNHYAYISELKNLEIISKLSINNVAIPKKFIYINNRFFGYSMDYMKGLVLPRINKNTNYDQFISNLDKIEETINIFSNNKIEMRDINCFNILYDENNNLFNLVDVDCYKENKFEKIENIYKENLFYFNNTLLNNLTTQHLINYTLLYHSLKNMIRDGINNNITEKDIFISLKNYLENYSNKEIKTINDFRKVLSKEKE